ncbi:hypothetical protein A7K91_08390 [Paenibacillus oryzae]|uniref:Uncharacterized protein n=1 Tax=Paenibacillus oryzae TaxID=1844972 RepID=A0A1A5YQ98_9BACL|nr:hypothetical protein [Paenibacillus oryzae]OBR67743.1 hypothetical protein A7K91_08390 [Paenibacillus oryzae]
MDNIRADIISEFKRSIENMMRLGQETGSLVNRVNSVSSNGAADPKLKQHLINQIDRINYALINKLRDGVDIQIQSILRELEGAELQFLDHKSYRQGRGNSYAVPEGGSNDIQSSSSAQRGGVDLSGAMINTFRRVLTGSPIDIPMMIQEAIKTFKNVQTEQLKMTQNLMKKDSYNKDSSGNPLAAPDMTKVSSAISEIQSFIRQQALFYGTDYNELYQVGGIGSGFLGDVAEIKKLLQLTAQLQAIDPGSSLLTIAKDLESTQGLFDLEMADIDEKIVKPLAAVSKLTNISIEQLINAISQSDASVTDFKGAPEKAIVMAGMSIQTGSSASAAAMHEAINTLVKAGKANANSGKQEYGQMNQASLQGPLVSSNRAKQSVTISFDSLLQELTPAINKVTYALMNMADNVYKNGRLFVLLGDILSNTMIGMMMMERIKWGAGKAGNDIRSNRSTVSGLPLGNYALSLYGSMNENSQGQVTESSQNASSVLKELSGTVSSMKAQASQTDNTKSGVSDIFKSIAELGKGAKGSFQGMALELGLMVMERIAAPLIAEVEKTMSWEADSTESQRQWAVADKLDKDKLSIANTLKVVGENGLNSIPAYGSAFSLLYDNTISWINKSLGSDATQTGYDDIKEAFHGMIKMYNARGANLSSGRELVEYLNNNNIPYEQAVFEWSRESGRHQQTLNIRQEAMNKQYEDAQFNYADEEKLKKMAKEKYEKKYQEGEINYPSFSSDTLTARVADKVKEARDNNQLSTLRALLGGMRTDSSEYIEMRKKQAASIRQVMDDELAIIDRYIANAKEMMLGATPGSQEYVNAQNTVNNLTSNRENVVAQGEASILQEEWSSLQESYQNQVKRVDKNLFKLDLMAQAKELAAAYRMDTESRGFLETMKKIALGKVASMKVELNNLKAIEAIGDLSEDQALQVLQLQNSIASEQAKVKEYNLAAIGLGSTRIQENSSDRENDLLALRLRSGNPDGSSPIMRNRRIANAKAEVSEIAQVIKELQATLPTAGAEETTRINSEIRNLQKQSLQAQLGILDEMKNSSGTFNLPEGVKAMSRYEYLTQGNTHNTTTIGTGDVTVNITLPNVTNGMTASQLQQVGQSIGQGLSVGRVGGLRSQQAMNPHNYRS